MIDPAIRAIEIEYDLAAVARCEAKLLEAVRVLDNWGILGTKGGEMYRRGVKECMDEEREKALA